MQKNAQPRFTQHRSSSRAPALMHCTLAFRTLAMVINAPQGPVNYQRGHMPPPASAAPGYSQHTWQLRSATLETPAT
eukprot:scaffold125143_cov23-Tisochrysis_lutea.AAC.2